MEEEQRWEEEMRGTGRPLGLAEFSCNVSLNFNHHKHKLVTTRPRIPSSVGDWLHFTVSADTVAVQKTIAREFNEVGVGVGRQSCCATALVAGEVGGCGGRR